MAERHGHGGGTAVVPALLLVAEAVELERRRQRDGRRRRVGRPGGPWPRIDDRLRGCHVSRQHRRLRGAHRTDRNATVTRGRHGRAVGGDVVGSQRRVGIGRFGQRRGVLGQQKLLRVQVVIGAAERREHLKRHGGPQRIQRREHVDQPLLVARFEIAEKRGERDDPDDQRHDAKRQCSAAQGQQRFAPCGDSAATPGLHAAPGAPATRVIQRQIQRSRNAEMIVVVANLRGDAPRFGRCALACIVWCHVVSSNYVSLLASYYVECALARCTNRQAL